MFELNLPNLDCGQVFDACLNAMNNPRKSRLELDRDPFVDACFMYNKNAENGTIDQLKSNLFNYRNSDHKDDYVFLYDQKLVVDRIELLNESIYDTLLARSIFCPYCNQRLSSTIDHYLPKSIYSCYSINPTNLIPCCAECNTLKDVSCPEKDGREFIHPYFDKLTTNSWLECYFTSHSAAVVSYRISPSLSTHKLFNRISTHFSSLSLKDLYTANAQRELCDMRKRLTEIHGKRGYLGVMKHLRKEANSRDRINSWQFSLYNMISKDEWFCRDGFKLIPS